MKKYWKLLLCAALTVGAFTACEDVPEPYNIPTEQGGGGETPTGIEVTCAEAVELTSALADGASSAETYTITGYITEVVGEVSKNQQTFWMADAANGGRVFEAYWANLPEGVSEFKAGSKVKITGKLTKYVNNNTGKMTAEIKNATVEILEEGGGSTPAEGIAVTCAEAAELTNALADGGTSADTYTVTGYITEVVGSVSRNQQTFWMADTKDGGRVFEAYYANLPEGITEFKVGSKVKITGQLMKFVKDGKVTPEIKNANVEILEDGGGDTPAPSGEAKGNGTLADPYNAVAATKLATDLGAGNTSTDKYYIKGKVSEIKYQFDAEHGTATFFISDDGSKKDQFQIYSAYYLGNQSWKDGNKQIQVGDEVIVYGQLTNYNGTPETASKKAYIYSLNGKTEDDGQGGGGDPDPGTGGSTLADFTNGDFETWEGNQPVGWVNAATNGDLSQSTIAHGGNYSCKIETATANKRLAYSPLTLSAGTYTLSAWVRAETTSGVARLGIVTWKEGSPTNSYIYGGSEDFFRGITTKWQQISRVIEVSSDGTYSFIIMNSKESDDALLIDDITITKN